MNNTLLTFEINETKKCLEIHANKNGISHFIDFLKQTLETKDHQHLMTPAWGGTELSQEKQGLSNDLFNHVKICYWDTESE